jgi:hypothetical protein
MKLLRIGLTVQVVDRLTRSLRNLAGCVLDRSSHLISYPFAFQLAAAGCSAETLFQFAGETSTGTRKALFRAPQSGPVSSIFHVIVPGCIPRTGLIEHNVRRHSDPDTCDEPSKTFHS